MTVAMFIYEAQKNNKVRFLFNYKNNWRPLFWVKIANDGSLYLGFSIGKITKYKIGTKKVKKTVSFQYSEGKILSAKDIKYIGKISFHSSGVIHMAGKRFFKEGFRNL